jgi:hypothetical protein
MKELTNVALWLRFDGELIDSVRRKLNIDIHVMCGELDMSASTYTKLEKGAMTKEEFRKLWLELGEVEIMGEEE